ncbi:MAG TPA: PD-(D/E)XK nuclease-like domain-containing protein [Gemmatimonadaceae bacterium]|nr:PD-(D/E)XK nuclease-like domain-containing protein [Gemmatimonadaceae bacterium]
MSFETRFARISAEEYFADPCKVPALSSSIANILERQSPLHAWSAHPKLGGISRAPTKSLENGSLSHALLLDAGKGIEVIDAKDYRTKIAQEKRDAAREAGLVPVLEHEYKAATSVARTLRERFASVGISLDGDKELAALWTETARNGAEVQCRGMMDHLKLPVIYDLKSIRSANPEVCRRHVESYGYALQRAAYVSAVERILPEFAGRVDFVFVFYELEPPYAVTPIRLSGAFRELGERSWRRAVDRWEECLRTNTWPGYATSILDLEPSEWALSKDMDRQIAAMGFNNEMEV